jgi:hypothetical protein
MITLDGPEFYGFTIFCDDIRQEVGGKITYVGAYGGRLLVHGDFPVRLPKFALGITYIQRRASFIQPSKFLVFLPGDSDDQPSIESETIPDAVERYGAPAEDVTNSANSILAINSMIVLSPFEMKQPGHIKVRATRGDALVRLGALLIERAP